MKSSGIQLLLLLLCAATHLSAAHQTQSPGYPPVSYSRVVGPSSTPTLTSGRVTLHPVTTGTHASMWPATAPPSWRYLLAPPHPPITVVHHHVIHRPHVTSRPSSSTVAPKSASREPESSTELPAAAPTAASSSSSENSTRRTGGSRCAGGWSRESDSSEEDLSPFRGY